MDAATCCRKSREDGRVPPTWAAAADPQPTGAAFDIMLLLHVVCVVVGLGTVVVSAVQASRLARVTVLDQLPESLRTYYRPGTNWAGKVLVGVPIFGFALLALSHGDFKLGDWWVLAGLGLWVVAIGVTEGALWPLERTIATVLEGVAAPVPDHLGAAAHDRGAGPPWVADCRRVRWLATAVIVVLVVASVLMVAHP
jgi:hypothetical protein